jgi:hypothetical protein
MLGNLTARSANKCSGEGIESKNSAFLEKSNLIIRGRIICEQSFDCLRRLKLVKTYVRSIYWSTKCSRNCFDKTRDSNNLIARVGSLISCWLFLYDLEVSIKVGNEPCFVGWEEDWFSMGIIDSSFSEQGLERSPGSSYWGGTALWPLSLGFLAAWHHRSITMTASCGWYLCTRRLFSPNEPDHYFLE